MSADTNHEYVLAHLARIRSFVTRAASGPTPPEGGGQFPLDRIADGFRLTPFERDVLLLCTGAELDADIADACNGAATFALALAALPDPHWSAVTNRGALRRWALLELDGNDSTTGLLQRPVRIDERLLHTILGAGVADEVDDRIAHLVDPLPPVASVACSQAGVVARAIAAWSDPPPVVCLDGDPAAARIAAAAIGSALGLRMWVLAASDLPSDANEIAWLVRRLEREAVIGSAGFLLVCDGQAEPAQDRAAAHLAVRAQCPLFLAGRPRWDLGSRRSVLIDVAVPTADERAAEWQAALGPSATTIERADLDDIAHAFQLTGPALRDAAAGAAADIAAGVEAGTAVRAAARRRVRGGLDGLAERIEPSAGWDDLVLPDGPRRTLEEIAAHVRRRRVVHEDWRFAARGARGLAVTALFSGASGTGKTMAAEVLAGDVGFDLYRIDLASTVSKYIGETEKNLRVLFDRAEASSAVLLFDEADALFGRRSEVHDAHDRHANIEVSYLLQRMETYRGLAILTTNLPDHVDAAFLRRLRYVVVFPFPDAAARAAIWQRAFPPETPTEGLDFSALARLNVCGGNIRNIALSAAVLAADANTAVSMTHLLRAARTEYAKLAKPLTSTETRGWVLEEAG